MPYTGKVPWPSSATARGLWGNDKLAIDKGGNLPEKVENHLGYDSSLYLGSNILTKEDREPDIPQGWEWHLTRVNSNHDVQYVRKAKL